MSEIDNEDFSKNEELIKREDIKDSPFHLISTEKGHFVSVGEYRITELRETREQALDDIKDITWNRIVQIVLILMEQRQKIEQEIAKSNKVSRA